MDSSAPPLIDVQRLFQSHSRETTILCHRLYHRAVRCLSDNQVVSQATGTNPLDCTRVAISRRPETTTTEKKSDCDRQNRNILEVRSGESKGKTKQKEDPDRRVGFYLTYLLRERKKERKKTRKQAESRGSCLVGRRRERHTRKAGGLLLQTPCIVTHQKQSSAFFAVQLQGRLLIAIASDTTA
jgi:hypothetical protein